MKKAIVLSRVFAKNTKIQGVFCACGHSIWVSAVFSVLVQEYPILELDISHIMCYTAYRVAFALLFLFCLRYAYVTLSEPLAAVSASDVHEKKV